MRQRITDWLLAALIIIVIGLHIPDTSKAATTATATWYGGSYVGNDSCLVVDVAVVKTFFGGSDEGGRGGYLETVVAVVKAVV